MAMEATHQVASFTNPEANGLVKLTDDILDI